MKKLIAILLAALMALTGTLALAEGVGTAEAGAAFPGLTLTTGIDVDREVLASVLTTFGVYEQFGGIADTVAAVLDEVGDRLIVASDGVEYALTLKGDDLVNLVGQADDEGFLLGSSLIPSYVLTLSNETLGQLMEQMTRQLGSAMEGIDLQTVAEAIQGYAEEFIQTCATSVSFEEPEQGDYVMDGISYNAKVPVSVDIPAIIEAANKLVGQLSEDAGVQSAIQALQGMGINIDLSQAEGSVSAEELPTLIMEAYMNIDEQGDAGDPTLVQFDVYAPGAEEGADPDTMGDVLVDNDVVTVHLQFVSADNTDLTVTCAPADAGSEVRVDLYVQEMYFGFDVRNAVGDVTVVDADLFVLDGEKPLISSHTEIVPEGRLTLSAMAQDKGAIAVDDLMGENSQEALNSLKEDLMSNGLGGIVATALNAMPEEFSALAGLFAGGGAQDAEEAPAA